MLCGARQDTIAICSSRRYVHSLCRLSVCRTEVCVETTSVVDTHELLMAGWRDDARGHAPLCHNLVWRLQNRKLAGRHAVVCDLCGAEVAKVARHRGTFRCLLQCLTNEGIEIDTHNDMRSLRAKVQSSTFITVLKIMLSYVIQLARQRHILFLMTQPRAPRGTLLILPWHIDKQPKPKGSNCHLSVC